MKNDAKLDALLQNWVDFNAALMEMSEAEVLEVLEYEKLHRARVRVMLRAYNRYSKLRGTREKMELAQKAKG